MSSRRLSLVPRFGERVAADGCTSGMLCCMARRAMLLALEHAMPAYCRGPCSERSPCAPANDDAESTYRRRHLLGRSSSSWKRSGVAGDIPPASVPGWMCSLLSFPLPPSASSSISCPQVGLAGSCCGAREFGLRRRERRCDVRFVGWWPWLGCDRWCGCLEARDAGVGEVVACGW